MRAGDYRAVDECRVAEETVKLTMNFSAPTLSSTRPPQWFFVEITSWVIQKRSSCQINQSSTVVRLGEPVVANGSRCLQLANDSRAMYLKPSLC